MFTKIITLLISLFVMPTAVFAQADFAKDIQSQLNAGGETSGLVTDGGKTVDPRIVAAGIIETVLKILGAFFVALIVTGGYRLIKANGEETKITQARDTIQSAIIGILIILMAYSITYFVGSQIQKAVDTAAGNTAGNSK